MVAANAAVVGTLDLLHAGAGGHLDLSQLEAMSSQLGLAVLERKPGLVPETRMFRTAGHDRWVAVGRVQDDHLKAAIKPLLSDPVDPAASIAQLLEVLDADEVAGSLQLAGIAAYPVRDGRDLVTRDDQLAARDFYVDVEHPLAGHVLHEGIVAHLANSPGGIDRPAPLLGEHTDELLGELLSLSADDLAQLHQSGVLE